ncbi:MAG: amidohydrolase family protein [Gammaproteobacteria bacterium]
MKNLIPILSFIILFISSNLNSEEFLLKNATVFTGSSESKLEKIDVLISNGVISRMGKGIKGLGAKELDLEGKLITPGLISPMSQLGLIEIELEPRTRNDSSSIYSAGFSIASTFNPQSTLIPYNLTGGITLTLSSPSTNGLFSGLSSAFSTSGDLKESLVKKDIALIATISSGDDSKAAKLLLLEDFLNFARNRNSEKEVSLLPGNQEEGNISSRDLLAIKKVTKKEIPLIVRTDKASDILSLIDLADRNDINLIIAGASEGWMVAKEIADSDTPIILTPIDNIPSSFDSLGSRLDNASRLHKQGVKLIISSHETHNSYLSRQGAGIAVSYGLPWEEALRALTINITESFGLEGIGALREGYRADIVIWSGDPLELTTFVEGVFIGGKEIPVKNRSMKLRDRYLGG